MKSFKWSKIFYICFFVLIALLLVYFYLLGNIYLTNIKIDKGTKTLNQQNMQIEKIRSEIGYEKLESIRKLENSSNVMPWFDHITKIIDILNNLKSVDESESNMIVLTDFNVSLDKISLRGKVSNLRLLYYSAEDKGIKSLIDKFEALDFIEKMSIKNFTKSEDGYFDFVLEAKIINDANK